MIDYNLRVARKSFLWPGMTDLISNFIRNCEVCMEFSSSQTREPISTHQIPEYPFQRLNIDLGEVKENGKRIGMLVLADSWSGHNLQTSGISGR